MYRHAFKNCYMSCTPLEHVVIAAQAKNGTLTTYTLNTCDLKGTDARGFCQLLLLSSQLAAGMFHWTAYKSRLQSDG